MKVLIPLFLVLLSAHPVSAEKKKPTHPKVNLKVGVLSPDGSAWAIHLKDMAKEIKKATDNRIKMKFYFGGSQGDEPDVLKKMRIGQLHGGIFTGKTLGDVHKDIRVLELPFSFYSDHKKAAKALKALTPELNKGILKNGLKNLGFFGIGMVYLVSQKKAAGLKELQGVKIWYWEGDRISKAMIDILKFSVVPVPLPDVLNSLQTGILQAAYAPPLGITALQWDSKVSYLIDFPIAFALGGFLLSQKAWKKITSPAYREAIEKIATRYIQKIDQANVEDNRIALEVLKKKGITFLKFPPEDIKKGQEVRNEVISRLKGKELSPGIIKQFQKHL